MSFKDILRIWTDRTTRCSHCGRIHYIAHISKISEKQKKKLKFVKCHLSVHPEDLARGVKGYTGSYFEEIEGKQYCVDVYDYPISMKRAYITIGEKAKEEEEPDEGLGMKAYPGDFEGSYAYYDDEDVLAEEEDP